MISWFEKNSGVSWLITLIGGILIFYISSMTFESSSHGTNLLSILYHIMAFFCFSFFLFISISRGARRGINFFIGILFALVYAISDEIHQFFVPGRYCSFFDVGLDFVGILFAFMFYFVIVIWRRKGI